MSLARPSPPNPTRVLGVPVTPITEDRLFDRVLGHLETEQNKLVIGYMNLHGAALYHKDGRLREYVDQADLVYIDGMPIVWAAKAGGLKLSRMYRTTAIDWLIQLVERLAERGHRVFFVGGDAKTHESALTLIRNRVPTAEIDGHHGFFNASRDSEDSRRIVQQINAFRPDVLFICMGMPRQEAWVLDHLDVLQPKVVWCLGATLDYFGGAVKTPPRWMGQLGLEWLFRLLSEPRRLWYRYLIEPWSLSGHLVDDIKNRKKRRINADGAV